MTKRFFAILIAFTLIALCASATAFAGVSEQPRVIDNADLLTDSQEAELGSKLNEYSSARGCDIVILTEPDMEHEDFTFNGTVQDFADSYYELKDFDKDGVLIFVTLDDGEGYRMVWISTSGKCIKRLTDEEQTDILGSVRTDLTNDEYYKALSTMADEVSDKLAIRLKWYMLPLAIVIGFALAMIIMGVIRGKLKTVEMQRGAANYVRPNSMRVTASRDTYLYSHVSRTAKQSSSSGSSTHTSSHGGTHGGSGMRF